MAKHKVTFMPAGVTVEVDPADPPSGYDGEQGSLLSIALSGGVEIEHTCGGGGLCGTCHVLVDSGAENLCEAGDDELDVVDAAVGSALNSRLACQAVVCGGDVTVTIPGAAAT